METVEGNMYEWKTWETSFPSYVLQDLCLPTEQQILSYDISRAQTIQVSIPVSQKNVGAEITRYLSFSFYSFIHQ